MGRGRTALRRQGFCDTGNADVVVSTIHKAKGHEYDDVYMLIGTPIGKTDRDLRCLYVGMTRARRQLFIYTDSPMFDGLPADRHIADNTAYNMPEEIMLQLSYKDVNLGFSKDHKAHILSMRAGEKLTFSNGYFYSTRNGQPVAQVSHRMAEQLATWASCGYKTKVCTIRFIVAWRPGDAPKDQKEYAIPLIDMTMEKKTCQQTMAD